MHVIKNEIGMSSPLEYSTLSMKVPFSSVPAGIYALGKAHMRATPSHLIITYCKQPIKSITVFVLQFTSISDDAIDQEDLTEKSAHPVTHSFIDCFIACLADSLTAGWSANWMD